MVFQVGNTPTNKQATELLYWRLTTLESLYQMMLYVAFKLFLASLVGREVASLVP